MHDPHIQKHEWNIQLQRTICLAKLYWSVKEVFMLIYLQIVKTHQRHIHTWVYQCISKPLNLTIFLLKEVGQLPQRSWSPQQLPGVSCHGKMCIRGFIDENWWWYTHQKSNIDIPKWPYFRGVHLFQTVISGIQPLVFGEWWMAKSLWNADQISVDILMFLLAKDGFMMKHQRWELSHPYAKENLMNTHRLTRWSLKASF